MTLFLFSIQKFSVILFSPYSDGSKCNGIRKGDLVKIKVWFEIFCLMGLKISSIVPPHANQSTQPLSNFRVFQSLTPLLDKPHLRSPTLMGQNVTV